MIDKYIERAYEIHCDKCQKTDYIGGVLLKQAMYIWRKEGWKIGKHTTCPNCN